MIEKLTAKEFLKEMGILYTNKGEFAHLIGSYFEQKRAKKIYNTLDKENKFL